MLWKKSWQPEAVLMLAGGIVLSFFAGSLAGELLRRAGVTGFQSAGDAGSVLAATLSFHGAVLGLGLIFLKVQAVDWREVLGLTHRRWRRHLLLAAVGLVVILPLMLGLKLLSEWGLKQLGWPVQDQDAVTLFSHVKSVWLRVYLTLFAVVAAPVAEEFFFRGLLFSAAKKLGWRKFGWIGVSLLFAFIHNNAPTFLPLFVFALTLTWLYEKTEGLLAPIAAHSLFNAANLVLLALAEKSDHSIP